MDRVRRDTYVGNFHFQSYTFDMSSKRLIKQIIYGFFYLVFFSGLGYGIYFLVFRASPTCFDNRQNQDETAVDCGGSCVSCALKNLSPVEIFLQPKFLNADLESGSAYFQLKNSNSVGADHFSYYLDFYDVQDGLIDTVSGTSFVYPRSIKTIVEAPIRINFENIGRVGLRIEDFNWRLAEEFSQPDLRSRAVKSEIIKDQIRVTGLALNNNSFKLSAVNIAAVIFSKSGREVAASKTVIKDLDPFEERAFTVLLPKAGDPIDTSATLIFVDGLR